MIISSWVPTDFILPLSNTRILSASWIDEILWAMIIFVVSGIFSLNTLRISASVFVSTALVESSRIRIFGFFKSALAIQSLCFCPPDTFVPPRSMWVSYPAGKSRINSSAWARRHAFTISSSVASSFPHRRFSLIVPEKRTSRSRFLRQHLRNPFPRCPRHDEHHKRHGYHHQTDQNIGHICKHTHKLPFCQASRNNHFRTHP